MSKQLWLDLETTGLYPDQHHVLEVGLILTNGQQEEISRYQAVINQPKYVLEKMNDVCHDMHTSNNLMRESLQSTKLIDQVEQEILNFIRTHVYNNETLILCGSSIHFDRSFIKVHMHGLDKRLHYRMIDVTSYKEGIKGFFEYELPKSKPGHRSIPDIEGSLYEFKQYMKMIMVKAS